MLLRSVQSFFKLFKYNTIFAIVSLLSLTFAMLSFLILSQKDFKKYVDNLNNQAFYAESQNPITIQNLYDDIKNNKDLPQIQEISISNEKYTGYESIKPNYSLLFGRYFTPEEMDEAANVAIISTAYFSNLNLEDTDNALKKGIEIQGESFKPVGFTNDIQLYFTYEDLKYDQNIANLIALPYQTFLKLGMKANMLYCNFEKASVFQDKSKRLILKNIVERYKDIDSYYIPASNFNAIKLLYDNISLNLLYTFVGLIAVAIISTHLFKSNYKRYLIYIMYGARKKHIILMMSINILILNILSFVLCEVLLNFVFNAYIDLIGESLPIIWHISTFAFCFTFSYLMVILNSIPMLFKYNKIQISEVN